MVSKSLKNQFKQFEFTNPQLKSFNENENKSKPEFGIFEPKKKILCGEIKDFLNIKFGIDISDVISGSRYKDNLLLHSKSYNKKRNSNSYTISFSNNNEIHYGEIIEFYEIKNQSML